MNRPNISTTEIRLKRWLDSIDKKIQEQAAKAENIVAKEVQKALGGS